MTPHWLFPKRIGRLSWLARTILAIAIFLPVAVCIAPNSPIRPHVPTWLFETVGWFFVIVFSAYAIGYIHLPRARSLGLHGASLVLLIIPIANICLFMMFLFGGEGYWTRITNRNSLAATNDTNVA